jgi:hypothetical protein
MTTDNIVSPSTSTDSATSLVERWNGAIVSDINAFTCGSAPISCFDPASRTIYAPYLASRKGFGEQHEIVALAAIPVEHPENAKSTVMLEAGVEKDGIVFSQVIDPCAIFIDDKVRLFALIDTNQYYRVDFDPATGKVGPLTPVMCRIGPEGERRPLDADAHRDALDAFGMTGYDLNADAGEHLICTAKPAWDGQAFYGTVTSGRSQPLVFRCEDGETFDIVGAVPALAKYECQVALVGGRLFALLRGADGPDYFVSDDGGRTFTPICRLGIAETRPQLMAWRGKLLLGCSFNGETPNLVRDGRNNMHVYLANPINPLDLHEIVHENDPLGIVYFDFVDVGDGLAMLWSDSRRFPDKIIWGNRQGKDRLLFARVPLDDGQIAGSPALPPSLLRFAKQVGADCSELPRRLVVTGNHMIGETVWLPSRFTLELVGAHLTQVSGTFCNIFRADNAEDVVIIGKPGADGKPSTLDGGEYNGLSEKNANREGRPPIWVNNMILFTNVKRFRVEGLHMTKQRWWAANFVGCSEGTIRNLSFLADHTSITEDGTVLDILRAGKYHEIRVKNADGVDLRAGCHDIVIEDITGFTEDDTVALTCLPGRTEKWFLPPDAEYEIRDITVRRVHSSSCCSIVRLLAQGGTQMHRILVEDVRDTGDGETYYTGHAHTVVNLGDCHAYSKPQATPADVTDITIRKVGTHAQPLLVRGAVSRLTAEEIGDL